MQKLEFGLTHDGEKASKYVLVNKEGMEIEVSDFGALILAIRVADKAGKKIDVQLGYDTLEEYYVTFLDK